MLKTKIVRLFTELKKQKITFQIFRHWDTAFAKSYTYTVPIRKVYDSVVKVSSLRS